MSNNTPVRYPTLLQLTLIFFSFSLLISCKDSNSETKTAVSATEKPTAESDKDLRKGLFEKIPASKSGIKFANNLQEDITGIENLFDFDYFYNGAGVGIEDINNDGLMDIFFAGNQQPNKLYLNLGDFTFEDISEKAHINAGKVWANGVTFADVNGDGYMDIYVSQGGPKRDYDRSNLLYINQGDLTFEQQAESYGLDDKGISTQSVFFDYDKDGDLDCFVSNENEFYGLDPMTFFNQMKVKKENLLKSSTHLYENRNGTYVDVTEPAGVLAASFGLGVVVGDVNNDSWPDIYVANDYYVPDALYINNKNGTFSNKTKEHTRQVSFFGMGVDLADINNDALQDIFVLDMASSDHIRSKTLMASMDTQRFSLLVDRFDMPYQYMFNSLQVNAGDNTFHNVAQLSKVSKTDWSWAGLMVDFDLDGRKDIYVTNGYRRYALDNDSQRLVLQAKQTYRGNVPMDVKQRLYNALPSEKLSNILYHNQDDLEFKNETSNWGFLEPSFSNGAAYADLDNDGDLDLVVSNIDDVAFVYKNNSVEKQVGNYLKVVAKGNHSEALAKVSIHYQGTQQFIETKRVKGYLSATTRDAYFGLDEATTVDTVRVVWPSGRFEERYDVAANSELVFNESEALASYRPEKIRPVWMSPTQIPGLQFTHRENTYDDFEKEILLPYKQSTLGPMMTKADVNGDQLEDVYIGGAAGQAGALFIQTASGFTKKNTAAFNQDAAHEDMQALFFDADQDGDMDLYVVSGGNEFEAQAAQYQDRLYLNNGQGGYSRSADATIASLRESGKSVAALDYDQDGDLDLLVGNRIVPQHYPMPAGSYLLENNQGSFTKAAPAVISGLEDFGMINEVIATDFNEDGWTDLIAVGEWTGIGMFQNNQGTFTDVSRDSGLNLLKGLWFSVAETDINNDGKKDYLVGNMGSNIKYKASEFVPFKVFGNDFDDNGTYDIVLSSQYRGKDVPLRGRECSSQQMPFITDKFQTYNEFANASLYDIYGDKLNSAYAAEINNLKSVALIQKADGGFEVQYLPNQAQTFPLLDAVFADINGDGYQDAIALGNIYDTEVETPRMDMGTGLVLLGGENGYQVADTRDAGLFVQGDAKSILQLQHKGANKSLLLVGANNGSLQVYQVN